jgi:hypothetical protein
MSAETLTPPMPHPDGVHTGPTSGADHVTDDPALRVRALRAAGVRTSLPLPVRPIPLPVPGTPGVEVDRATVGTGPVRPFLSLCRPGDNVVRHYLGTRYVTVTAFPWGDGPPGPVAYLTTLDDDTVEFVAPAGTAYVQIEVET